MMIVGEETGKIDEILIKVADFYEEEVDTVIDSLASIIEPLMIIVLGALVGLIAAFGNGTDSRPKQTNRLTAPLSARYSLLSSRCGYLLTSSCLSL
jgi:hypothetical protein